MKKQFLLIMAALLLTAPAAFAGTVATGTNTVSPTLVVNANIIDVVILTLKTGVTAGISHCTIAGGGGGDFNVNFGTVDGLGVSTGNCNLFAPTTLGQTPALYYTDYQLTPTWAGVTATAAGSSIKAFANTLEAGVFVAMPAVDTSTTAGLTAASFSQIGTAAGTATPVVSGTVLSAAGADGVSVNRFLGLSVSPTAAAGAGAGTALQTTVTFTMTIN